MIGGTESLKEVQAGLKLPFPRQLKKAIFVDRPNRFIIHCHFPGSEDLVVAHLPDPGRLTELLVPGREVWLMDHDNPNRKTKFTAVLCENPGKKGFVSINTTYPNQLVEKGLKEGYFTEFSDWEYKRAEYTVGNSRWDFLLENTAGKQLLLEVKSVTLAEDGRAMFPDAVTARGAKHMRELAELAADSIYETAVLFIVQREDVRYVTTAAHIDQTFDQALKSAKLAGVKLFARVCQISTREIGVGDSVPVLLEN